MSLIEARRREALLAEYDEERMTGKVYINLNC